MIGNRVSIEKWAKASPRWVGYAVTLVAELALTALLALLQPVFPLADYPIPYVLPMMMIVYLFGDGPAVVAFFLGLICFVYLLPPYHTLWPPATTASEWAGLTALLMGTSIVGFAAHVMRTSENRAEALAGELQKTNEHMRDMLESIAECFFALDSSWRFLDINRIAEEIVFGRRAQELLGRTYLQEYPEMLDSEFYKRCQNAIQTRREAHFEDWFEYVGRWFECHVFPRDERLEICLRDITDRRNAEESMQQSEEKFRNLVESTSDWFWEVDVNCIYTYASPRVRDLLGYEPEEVLGRTPFDFMPEDEAEDVCEIFTTTMNERKLLTLFENTLIHNDGHTVIVETSGAPIIDERGAVKGYRGTDRDITERKRADVALRESESRYRSLIETMNEGFGATDENYLFTYVNLRFAEMLGYAADEMVGHHLQEFLDEENRAVARGQAAERRAGRHDHFELAWTARDGRKVYTLVSPKPVFGGDGQFAGSFATLTDISDRKHAEESLRESEQKFRQLFHNANDAILLYEMGPNGKPGKIVEVNDVTCRRLEYTRSELLTMSLLDIDAPEVVGGVPEIVKDILEQGHSTFELVHVSKSGNRIPVEVSSHLFDMDGKKVVLSIARDITERKLVEDRLRKSEERFRALFERAADELLLHDLSGRFIEVNEAACTTLGYSRDELLKLNVSDVVIDWDNTALYELWDNLVSVGPMTVNAAHRRKDGSTIIVEGRLSPFEYRDQLLILAVVRDITERTRVEEERRALEKHLEEQKRQFYRETIFSVTNGKLDICDDCDVTPYRLSSQVSVEVRTAAQVSNARHEVEAFCRVHGFVGERLELFMVGVGEAITNAVKHGAQGTIYAGLRGEDLWVGIEDNGTGIESVILPRAVLLRGFSTKPSLGLGYSVMLDVADRIHLKTDAQGTFVVLEKAITESSTPLSLHNLPDTWNSVAG